MKNPPKTTTAATSQRERHIAAYPTATLFFETEDGTVYPETSVGPLLSRLHSQPEKVLCFDRHNKPAAFPNTIPPAFRRQPGETAPTPAKANAPAADASHEIDRMTKELAEATVRYEDAEAELETLRKQLTQAQVRIAEAVAETEALKLRVAELEAPAKPDKPTA